MCLENEVTGFNGNAGGAPLGIDTGAASLLRHKWYMAVSEAESG